ncbi:hypothetical protein EON65_40930 [archaeon]|nr:MAG: hypothetical protein EON65_40930 [archaeon]
MDEQLRDIYNRFGPNALDFDPRKDEMKLISDIAIQYVFWGVLSFIFTLHSSAKASRVWLAIVMIVILSAEVCFCLTGTSLPVWMLPNTLTEHELIFYLHSAYPAILAFLAALSMFLYVDIDLTSMAVLKDVFMHQQAVHGVLQEVDSVVDIASKPILSSQDVQHIQEVRSRLMRLRSDMELQGESFGRRIEDLKQSSSNPGANYYWILFVLLYGGIYFLQ